MKQESQFFYNQIKKDLGEMRRVKKELFREIESQGKSLTANLPGQVSKNYLFESVYIEKDLSLEVLQAHIEDFVYKLTGQAAVLLFEYEKGVESKFDILFKTRGEVYFCLKLLENTKEFDEVKEKLKPYKKILTLQVALYVLSNRIDLNFDRVEILNNITLIVSSSLKIDDVYTGFAEEIRKIIPFDRISIALFENKDNLYVFGIATNHETKLSKGIVISAATTAPGWVVKNNCTHIANDLQKERSFWEDKILLEEGIRSAIRVPLRVKGNIIGTLNLNNQIPFSYGYEEQIFLEQVANQVATAVQNAQLYEEKERKSAELHKQNVRLATLNAIAQVAGNSLDLEETLRKSLSTVMEVMNSSTGAIFLVEENNNELKLRSHKGFSEISLKNKDSKLLNQSIIAKVIITGEPVVFYNGEMLAYIPLKAKNKVIGVMPIKTASHIGVAEKDWNLLIGIGNQIGVAIENALLYEKIKYMAEFDALTEVYNRRIFFRLFEQEISRAKRYGLTFSVLILDVDLFKEYNDQFGHLAGDKALRDMGRILQGNLREMDVVARYGGEEFVILAPELSKEQGFEMAERIRKVIEVQSNTDQFPTVSIGISTYPEDGEELDILLRNADAALYVAKEKRNCTQIFSEQLYSRKLTKA